MQEIETLKEEARPVVKQAKAVTINNAEDMTNAVEMLSVTGKYLDMVVAYEEKKTKTWKEKVKAVTAEVGPMKKALKIAVETLRTSIGAYQTQQDRIAKEAETKLAARMLKGTLKPATALKKMDELERPETKVATMAGSVSFRTDKVLKIVNEADIPREYLVVDEKKLLAALKAGVTVKGAELEEKKTVVNKR